MARENDSACDSSSKHRPDAWVLSTKEAAGRGADDGKIVRKRFQVDKE
jgi:hypothetical protein